MNGTVGARYFAKVIRWRWGPLVIVSTVIVIVGWFSEMREEIAPTSMTVRSSFAVGGIRVVSGPERKMMLGLSAEALGVGSLDSGGKDRHWLLLWHASLLFGESQADDRARHLRRDVELLDRAYLAAFVNDLSLTDLRTTSDALKRLFSSWEVGNLKESSEIVRELHSRLRALMLENGKTLAP